MAELPYTPTPQATGTSGPANLDQWVMDFALSAAGSMANGTLNAGEGTVFTNAFMDQWGLNIRFDPSDFNVGARGVSQNTLSQLIKLGEAIAANWNNLTPQQRSAFPDPTGLPKGTQPISDVDKANTVTVSENEKDREAQRAQAAAAEAGATERTKLQIASTEGISRADREALERQAAADRLSTEKIARENRESTERISLADRLEFARQFDLGEEQDRKEFNASFVKDLFDRGIELAKAPVDWLGYQYYLENLGIPINSLTMGSASSLMGAIPPTGPSEAGPMVGGPAVMDGDMALAQQVGAQNPGPMAVDMAVSQNPGGTTGFVTANGLTATDTVNNFGGMETVRAAWEKAIAGAQDRFQNLAGGMGDYFRQAWESFGANPARRSPLDVPSDVSEMLQRQQGMQQGAGLPTQPEALPYNLPPLPNNAATAAGQNNVEFGQDRAAAALAGNQAASMGGMGFQGGVAPPPGANFSGIAAPDAQGQWGPTAAPTTPGALTGAFGNAAPDQPSTGGPYTGNEGQAGVNVLGQQLPEIPGVTQPAQPAVPATPGQPAPATAGQPQAAQPAAPAQPATPATPGQQQPINPDMERAIQVIAQSLGLTVEQVRAMFPVELLSQTQAPGGVQNAPIIQSLRNQARPGIFNTGPRSGSPFTQLRGFGGVETGVRGGQDVNAGHYLGSLQPTQEMMNGVFQAQGLSVPGTLEQMLRASPVADLETGMTGRRRF